MCDEEAQGRETYGRQVALDALVRSGVARKGQSEDEWIGSVRTRDNFISEGEARAMPGLWMEGSEGTPNWKSAEHMGPPSTCAAAYAGLRRVCACKAVAAVASDAPSSPIVTPHGPWTAVLTAGESATGLVVRFVYERGKGLFPNTAAAESTVPAITRYLMPESNRLSSANGTYVLVLELERGALGRLVDVIQQNATGRNVRIIKVSSNGHPGGDPEILLTRSNGFRVYEGTQAKETDAPTYYSGTKLAYINDRAKSSSEMLVRSGPSTTAINMHPSWPGGANNDGLMELQFHEVVQRAVFLWGPDTVSPDVSALKAEV